MLNTFSPMYSVVQSSSENHAHYQKWSKNITSQSWMTLMVHDLKLPRMFTCSSTEPRKVHGNICNKVSRKDTKNHT